MEKIIEYYKILNYENICSMDTFKNVYKIIMYISNTRSINYDILETENEKNEIKKILTEAKICEFLNLLYYEKVNCSNLISFECFNDLCMVMTYFYNHGYLNDDAFINIKPINKDKIFELFKNTSFCDKFIAAA